MNIYDLTFEEILKAIRGRKLNKPLPSYADRKKWEKVSGKQEIRDIIEQCTEIVNEPIPVQTATKFMDFIKNGERGVYGVVYKARRHNLVMLAVAYCATLEQKYLHKAHDYFWSLCEDTSWITSAHVEKCGYTTILPSNEFHGIDLNACMTAFVLIEAVDILEGAMEPEIAVRVKNEIRKRLITPYYLRDQFIWINNPGNWNSVCHTGIIGAATYIIEDDYYLAQLIYKALKHIKIFYDYYDDDGGTPEGVNCWMLGLGHYLMLSDLLERRSKGELSLAQGQDKIVDMLKFGQRIHMYDDVFVNFSDAEYNNSITPILGSYAKNQLEIDLSPLQNYSYKEYTWVLRTIFTDSKKSGKKPEIKSNYLFNGIQWMVSRKEKSEDTLILACKGGNNGEEHNHNDAGAFLIHNKKEELVGELGKERFTRNMFTKDRYSYLATSSGGHSVPIINGCLQAFGTQYQAEILKHVAGDAQDIISFDLTGVYPKEAGLNKLIRTFVFDRKNDGVIEITDEVQLDDSGKYEGVVWVKDMPKVDCNSILICKELSVLKIKMTGDDISLLIDKVENAVRGETWHRIVFTRAGFKKDTFEYIFEIT